MRIRVEEKRPDGSVVLVCQPTRNLESILLGMLALGSEARNAMITLDAKYCVVMLNAVELAVSSVLTEEKRD